MRSKSCLILFIALLYGKLYSQNITKPLQYGVGMKIEIDFLTSDERILWINWRIATSFGFSYNPNQMVRWKFIPSAFIDYYLVNGGIGGHDIDIYRDHKFKAFGTPDNYLIASVNLAGGWLRDLNNNPFQHRPMYYFLDYTYPVLSNPMYFTLALGTSFSYSFYAGKIQRVSHFNLVLNNFQLLYYNDGPPFSMKGVLGDREDRWFSGGLILNYYNPYGLWGFDNMELAFHKFTGFNAGSFNASCALGLPETSYNDAEQSKYNTGIYTFRLLDSKSNFGVGISAYDFYKFDAQHLIHFLRYISRHSTPNHFKWGLTFMGIPHATNFVDNED